MSNSDPQQNSSHKASSDLQSANHLLVEAIVGMTDIVESMHKSISPMSKLTGAVAKEGARGLSGLVYNSIRSLTELVGKSLDTPLAMISKVVGKSQPSEGADAFLSGLNGVMGDHLVKRESPLAITMMLKQHGQQVSFSELAQKIHNADGKLVVMVHGLCMNHTQWSRAGHNHGEGVAQTLGHEVIYLHYNTGQHISENGKLFSILLEQLSDHYGKLESHYALDISVVAHSMGGLVTRSAHHQANLSHCQWANSLNKLVFLGTPHHGAPLEKAGNWIDLLLGVHPYTSPLKRLTSIRSAGITDLRHGNLTESDWQKRNRFDFSTDKRTPIALPKGVECFAIASTIASNVNKINEQVVGDGLVSVDSALGIHQNPRFTLKFPKQNQLIVRQVNHMQLLNDQDVYSVIKRWLATE